MITLTKTEIKWINLELGRTISKLLSTGHPLTIHYAECYQKIIDKLDAALEQDAKRIRISDTGK